MVNAILKAYSINPKVCSVESLSTGLINKTWKVTYGDDQYILQSINTYVFEDPRKLTENMRMLSEYLQKKFPDYLFVSPLNNLTGQKFTYSEDDGFFRAFRFVKDSRTVDAATSAEQAYEAAQQFGKFTTLLSGFDPLKLHITIPDFHNLTLRYHQFDQALLTGNKERVRFATNEINDLKKQVALLNTFENIKTSKSFITRVTHHDTKISNVLFDQHNKGLCVIDLDTVMPGYFISDVGDMLRTYLSPTTEEDTDLNKIDIQEDFFKGIVSGYLSYMRDQLTDVETGYFLYAGYFLTYMQALRFMTDFINNDVYYGAKYELHNFNRARNQLRLLNCMKEKEEVLDTIVKKELRRNFSLGHL